MSHQFTSIIRWASISYLLVSLALWVLIFSVGDRWWPATTLLFGPRWLVALPLLILFPLAIWRNRFSLLPLLIAMVIIFGPFMGICLPFGKSQSASGRALRVVTCNVNNGRFNEKALVDLIYSSSADIVALQEYPPEIKLKVPSGWQIVKERGLAILSHFPLREGGAVQVFHPPNPWPKTCLLCCIVSTPGGDLRFCSVQLPTPRYGLQNVLDRTKVLNPARKGLLINETAYRWRAASEVQHAIAKVSHPVILAGDLNLPIDSPIYRQTFSRYRNSFSDTGFGYGWTQRVSVKGIVIPIRIDHVLMDKSLFPLTCEVGPDVGSDHLPLISDIGMN